MKPGWAALLVAVAMQGCESSDQLSGNYQLIGSVNTRLPVLLQNEAECAIQLDSGRLTFRDGGKFDSDFRIVKRCPATADSVMPDPGARGGTYELKGDTLNFRNDAGDFAGIGIRKGDTLTITGIQHTLVYSRE